MGCGVLGGIVFPQIHVHSALANVTLLQTGSGTSLVGPVAEILCSWSECVVGTQV